MEKSWRCVKSVTVIVSSPLVSYQLMNQPYATNRKNVKTANFAYRPQICTKNRPRFLQNADKSTF